MIAGFRKFILRGNVIDLAVGFIIGGAFTSVVNSLVADLMTPLLGVFGMPDLSNLSLTLGQAEVRYGAFLTALIAFMMVAIAIYFFVVVPINRVREPTDPTTRTCPYCASEIPLAATRCPHCTSQLG